MTKFWAMFKSRRLWAAAVGLIVIVANHYGHQLDENELLAFAGIISSWIFGDSIRQT